MTTHSSSAHRPPAHLIELVCHPATPCTPELQINVSLSLAGAVVGDEASGGLLLSYCISGDVTALKIPPPVTSAAADGLWQHTCFEAFVAIPGEAAYREFNFSPSGQWAAYRFSQERVRDLDAEETQTPMALQVEVAVQADSLRLQAWLPYSALPPTKALQPWQWGLTAVLEDLSGQLSYWALQHPAARPDFHHRDGLSLALSLPTLDITPVDLHTS